MAIKKLDEEEFENLVVELAKQGKTSEKIGLILKKEHNISSSKQAYGKRISRILREKNLYTNADIKNLTASVEKLKKHLAKNKKDKTSKRALMIREAKLRKMIKIKED